VCHDEIRVVETLTYTNAGTRTHYNKMTLKGHFARGLAVTYDKSRVFYRITVEKEIRAALMGLPNGRIPDVTVEAITNGGYLAGAADATGFIVTGAGMASTPNVFDAADATALVTALAKGARQRFSTASVIGTGVLATADGSAASTWTILPVPAHTTATTYTTDFAPHILKLDAAATLAHPVNGLNAGDTIRIGSEFRRIVHYTGAKTTVASDFYAMTGGLQEPMVTGAKVFKQNGMMYDITFESGCRTHADCRNNGIDENESDGPDATHDIEGNDMGAFCHAGGACICSGSAYFGDGCTTDGRDTHAAPKTYVSGNLRNLECDKSDLTPSRVMRSTATVSRTAPRTVILTATAAVYESAEETLSAGADGTDAALTAGDTLFPLFANSLAGMDAINSAVKGIGMSTTIATNAITDTGLITFATGGGALSGVATGKFKVTNSANAVKVGDKIRIEGQVRNVVFVSDLCQYKSATTCSALNTVHYLEVDEPFVEDEFSTYTNIFAAKTMVEKLESDSEVAAGNGDDLASCVVTDMRALTSTHDICTERDGNACGTATVTTTPITASDWRIVTQTTASAKMMDPREVDIGDRIRIMTAGERTPSSNAWSVTDGHRAAVAAPKWETRTIDSVTYGTDGQTGSFSVSTGFSAAHAAVGRAIYNDGSGTMEVSTCSNRGLCDESTGECACFAGYTDVDCSHQNALSI
jgi:hypothetical protein